MLAIFTLGNKKAPCYTLVVFIITPLKIYSRSVVTELEDALISCATFNKTHTNPKLHDIVFVKRCYCTKIVLVKGHSRIIIYAACPRKAVSLILWPIASTDVIFRFVSSVLHIYTSI